MEQKEASWILKQAKEADLCLDDDLRAEVAEKLSGKKRTKGQAKNMADEDDANFDPLDDPYANPFEAN